MDRVVPEVDRLPLEEKLEHFWKPVRRPPPLHARRAIRFPSEVGVAARQIEDFERVHGVKLPASFVRLLQERDGGYPRWTRHPGINGEFSEVMGVAGRRQMKTDWFEELEYMAEEEIAEPTGLESMVGLAGDGHYFVCLDYGRGSAGAPVVTFVDVEVFEPASVLATSFDALVDDLLYDTPMTCWALPGSDTDDMASVLGAALDQSAAPYALGQNDCPDDEPGHVITFEAEPKSKRARKVRVRPNLQRDGVRMFPWRSGGDWIVSLGGPPELRRLVEGQMTRAGLRWTLVCEPGPWRG